jgi:hypothetical protein
MANQYTYSVPFTEQQLFDDYCNKFMSQIEIAKKYNVSQRVVWRAMKKMGIPTRKAYKRNQKGPNNDHWKGGRVLDGKRHNGRHRGRGGYWLVRDENHPNRNKAGYVYEHIKNVLEKEGLSELEKGMCVHHIDGDKWNNNPSNLQICTKQKHGEYHASIIPLLKPLLEKGVIYFDEDRGYLMKEGGQDAGE